jgi:hypothetical protein
MPDQRHICECDWKEIELRVLAFMTDNGPERQQAINRRERTVNALMTPTGRYRRG